MKLLTSIVLLFAFPLWGAVAQDRLVRGFVMSVGGPTYEWGVADAKVATKLKARIESFPPALNRRLREAGLGSISFFFSPDSVIDGQPNPEVISIGKATGFQESWDAFVAAWNDAKRSGLSGCEVIPVAWGDNRHDLFVVVHGEGARPYEEMSEICFEAVIGGFETW